jgi:triosephosphate isomerase
MKRHTIVANWKMQLPLQESISWLSQNKKELSALEDAHDIILCPETIALFPSKDLLDGTHVLLGAQNCSAFLMGAYTGETSVHSLVDAGVSHCIVGHYERRHFFKETDEEIAQKCLNLSTVGIIPILCIGAGFNGASLSETLEKQLSHLRSFWLPERKLFIAYEPAQSIQGTEPAPIVQIETIGQSVRDYLSPCDIQFLYGGSVDASNAQSILSLPGIDGILIGRASLDFQNLKKIVSSLTKAS